MNQDEIKAEIEKLVVLSAALDEFVTRVATLEAKLAGAEKPELRRGGYGVDRNGPFFLHENSHSWIKEYERGTGSGILSSSLNKTGNNSQLRVWASQIIGNIFDDLNALSEPLKDFDYGDITGKVSEDDPNRVCIGGFWHTIKTAKTLSMYIQRLIHTAGQELAK